MLKHSGQAVSDMKKHEEIHTQKINEGGLKCITCDKEFQTQHSLKQHLDTKHKSNNIKFPVGHPGRYEQQKNIKCTKCGKLFQTGREVQEHMVEHTVENNDEQTHQFVRKEKICRYFKNGFCFKGEQCAFKHVQYRNNDTPVCRNGQECKFFLQNRCKFSHESVRVQTNQKKSLQIS